MPSRITAAERRPSARVCPESLLLTAPAIKRMKESGDHTMNIVNPGGGDIGIARPLLDFGDVSLIIERIRGGCRPKGMGADLKPQSARSNETLRFDT
jgi:hypothetical protein